MYDGVRTFTIILMIGIGCALLFGSALYSECKKEHDREQECERKGGTWLNRELKCIETRRIPIEH